MLPPNLVQFLTTDSDPSVRYYVLRDLMDRPPDDHDLREAHEEIGTKGWAARILADQQDAGYWETFRGDGGELYVPKYVATNWRLIVLADLGLNREDPRIDRAAQLIFRYWSGPEGVFGEPGSELCITGNVVRTMVRFGFGDDPRIRSSVDWLVQAQKPDGGWHCFPSEVGTLDGWEALAAFAALPEAERSDRVRTSIQRGAEFYLTRGLLRESDGSTYPPWKRIHYPNHYFYDFLVGLDVLTELGYGRDPRLRPAIDLLESKRGVAGTWSLEAVHPDLMPDDPYHPSTPIYPFLVEHLGVPSRWATLTALRVLRRAGRL